MSGFLYRLVKENFALKVFAVFLTFWGLLSLGFAGLLFECERRALSMTLMQQGSVLAGILASSSRLGVFSEDRDELLGPVAGVFEQKAVDHVVVYSRRGEPLISLKRKKTGVSEEDRKPEASSKIDAVMQSLESTPCAATHLETNEGWEFWRPVVAGSAHTSPDLLFFEEDRKDAPGEVIGCVKVAFARRSLEEPLQRLFYKSAVVWGIFLLMGACLTFWMAGRLMQPLRRLTDGVQRLGKGEAALPVMVSSRDEIGRLARSFNEMTASLETRESEKRELESRLMQRQKMEAVGTLAGGIAHDFNNVLAAVMGYLELALGAVAPDSDVSHNIDGAILAAKRGRSLIKQILLFSHRQQEDVVPVQMEELAEECLDMVRTTVPAGVRIDFRVKGAMADVIADPTQILQVLLNLTTNAAHAMPDGGVLGVELDSLDLDGRAAGKELDLKAGGYVRLTVSDTGHGIDPEILDKIFDPYFTTREKGKGSGLGLAVVHGIVKRHGGAIQVKSERGKGSVFEVYFPSVPRGPEETEPLSGASSDTGRHARILFVDDEAVIVETARKLLVRLGFEVTAFYDPVEALERFEADPEAFDLVITDVAMPNLYGDILAAMMRDVRPDLPIVLCTGYTERMTAEKAAAMGLGVRMVMKPLTSADFERIIEEVLNEAADARGGAAADDSGRAQTPPGGS